VLNNLHKKNLKKSPFLTLRGVLRNICLGQHNFLEIGKSSSQLFFPLFNATDMALYCKNDLVSSQNAFFTKGLLFIQLFKSQQIRWQGFRSLSSVLPSGRLFSRRTQKGPNKKWSSRTNLLPNF